MASTSPFSALPSAQGLYNPAHEHDACGVAMVATLKKTATHEIVQQGLTDARAELTDEQVLIYEIPLLVETKAASKFDAVITVEAPLGARIERLKNRGLEISEIEKRIASQASVEERKAAANFVIENDGNEEELLRKVETLWTEINASRN